ncbi:hypothetical protein VNI00_009756 [Paramarasmius palmivorus]|uniref:Cytochrome P450 n=1 Tax=Paramarasmius palmivorus TaxID=297713 RepID=A0AAW0CKX5_9AGAR
MIQLLSDHYYITAVAISVAALLYGTCRRSSIPLLPGPPGRWLIGNILQFPAHLPWLQFASWSRQYGSIIRLKLVNQNFIVLNSSKAVLDLFETRSNIYSDRPQLYLANNIMGLDTVVFNTSYEHPRFKTYRRMLHSGLSPRAVRDYQSLQIQEKNTFLLGLLNAPESFRAHIRRNAGAVIMKVAYGYEVTTDDDFFVKLAERSFQITEEIFSSPYMIDFFPILRHVPPWFPLFSHWQAAKLVIENKVEHIPFAWTKKSIDSGNYIDSFASRFLQPETGPAPNEEEEDTLKMVCQALYIGGADTTVAVLSSFFYLMETHPEIQRRAQAEVDSVTGGNRLPIPDDEKSMPFVTAMIKDILRWAPVAPLGILHRSMQDDIYDGYLIPKGSTIAANIWAITHDPDLYPNPDVFDPERHLGDNPQTDPYKFVFGFGRRICPGAHFAQRSLFLNISNVLAVFNLEMECDKAGKPVKPQAKFTNGATSHLEIFPCKIIVRAPHLLPALENME